MNKNLIFLNRLKTKYIFNMIWVLKFQYFFSQMQVVIIVFIFIVFFVIS